MNNLQYIYDNYFEYYKKYLQITCVINNIDEFNSINKFFSTNKLVKDINIRFSNQIQNFYELSTHIQKTFTKDYILELVKSNTFHNYPLEYKYYGDLLKKLKYRLLGDDAKNRKVKCIPFSNRTYIRANGKVQFCERIENMGLTDLSTQSMENVATKHLKKYQDFIEEKCNKCVAYNFCEMCFASFVTDSELDIAKANTKCSNFRDDVKTALTIYIDLMENNPKLLDIL